MQNKPNLRKAKMNVNSILTKDYERNDIFAAPENKANSNPIKANTKPIKANMNPKQTQYEPKTNPTCRGVASGEAGSKPISICSVENIEP